MVESDLPFSRMTAHRLMAIASDPRFVTHGLQLPPSWRTLYELTKLDDRQFEQGIADGTINPEMRRKDIERESTSDTSNEWFTPAEWVERARQAMGSIDCDPASCALGQETVQAAVWYDRERDGLTLPWCGNIWLNPPYARGLIEEFLAKLRSEREAGRVKQAIVLTDNRTDTGWFHDLGSISSAIALTRGRLRFHHERGVGSPENGSTLFYLGPNIESFTQAFADTCTILPGPVTATVTRVYKSAA
jgi:DNA N-6-adenine-methyltransferase (Dam)